MILWKILHTRYVCDGSLSNLDLLSVYCAGFVNFVRHMFHIPFIFLILRSHASFELFISGCPFAVYVVLEVLLTSLDLEKTILMLVLHHSWMITQLIC